MATHSSLAILIGQAKSEADAAFRHLQQLTSDRQNAQNQLSALRSYRQDYASRLQNASEEGLSASNYHNFRRFIATLDEAIVQQNGLMAQIEQRIQIGLQNWQARKRRLNSYEALLDRENRERRARENRSEQRANDEISINMARRAAKPH